MNKKTIDIIFNRVNYDPITYCWNWTGSLNTWLYGQIKVKRKNVLVHRFIYKYIHNSIPEDKPLVLHQCDNPKCCNPMHLYAGTNQDNSNDKIQRNRTNYQHGEQNKNSKLTKKQVIEIRTSKETQIVLAKRFSTSRTNIGSIQRRQTWKHIK